MKFHEFGIENEKTLVLLHGVDTTWKISFGKFIELAQKEYHIIAVADDGFAVGRRDKKVLQNIA